MVTCHYCKVQCENPKKCSQCKKTIYCSKECQKADWKVHKRSVCIIPPIIHKMEKMEKKMNLYSSTSVMGRLERMQDILLEERLRKPIRDRVWHCEGCTRPFHGAPPEERFESWDEEEAEGETDAGEPFKHCAKCDYTICEDCAHPEAQEPFGLEPPSGTCRCPTSNFGVNYCMSGPSILDGDRRKRYYGDRHPPMEGSGYSEEDYESTPRKCRNCGEVELCLTKNHLKDVAPGMT